MNNQEAIKVIKSNWPPENYTMLREALTMAIKAFEDLEKAKEINQKLLNGIDMSWTDHAENEVE